MDFYQDFDYDSENEDGQAETIVKDNKRIYLKGKTVKKNTFVYQSFAERVQKIKVRLSENMSNDLSFVKLEHEPSLTFSEKSSNFLTVLDNEKTLNPSEKFREFYHMIKPYTLSYILLVNNASKVLKAIAAVLYKEIELENKNEEQKIVWNDHAMTQHNFPFILSLIEILTGLIKDIRDEAFSPFLKDILPVLIKFLHGNQNPDVIEKIFSLLVNIFKFLYKSIETNFKKFFMTYSELIFSKNKFIRKFACQSVCYVVKNLPSEELNDIVCFLFEFFEHPEKLFAMPTMDIELKEVTHIEIEYISSSNVYFNKMLQQDLDERNLAIKKFLIECLSDMFYELLLGGSKTLSIKADILLERLIIIGQQCMKDVHNATLVSTFLKLHKNLNDKNAVQALFHYYLLLLTAKNNQTVAMSYAKMKLESCSNQIKYVMKSTCVETFIDVSFAGLIFIRELILKNYSKKNISFYVIDVLREIIMSLQSRQSNSTYSNEIQRVLIIEILSLTIFFFPSEFLQCFKDNLNLNLNLNLTEVILLLFTKPNSNSVQDSRSVNIFLKNLLNLTHFSKFLQLTFYGHSRSYDSQIEIANDEFDAIRYDQDTLRLIFDHILNTVIFTDCHTLFNILTSYDLLLIRECNTGNRNAIKEISYKQKLKKLTLDRAENQKIVQNYLSSTNEKSVSVRYNIDVFIEFSKRILLLPLIRDRRSMSFELEYIVGLIAMMTLENGDECKEEEYEMISDCLLNEFNNEGVYYLNKRQSLLNLILQLFMSGESVFIQLQAGDNSHILKTIVRFLLNQRNLQLGITYMIIRILLEKVYFNNIHQFLEGYDDKCLRSYLLQNSLILLSNNNTYKSEYLNFFQRLEEDNMSSVIKDIFSIMTYILTIEFDYQNDKKYTINFEILLSKAELLLNGGLDNGIKSKVTVLIWHFFLGSYWIMLTKSVWPVLSKCMAGLFQYISSSLSLSSSGDTVIYEHITSNVGNMIEYIHNFPSEEDYVCKTGKEYLERKYFSFGDDLNSSKEHEVEVYYNNIISINALTKLNKFLSMSSYFNGFLQGIEAYELLLLNSKQHREEFYELLIKILKMSNNKFEIFDSASISNEESRSLLSVLYNYAIEKKQMTSTVVIKLIECLLFIASKIKEQATIEDNIVMLKSLLYQQIIISKSQQIQKLCVEILINMDNRIKNYQLLLISVIETPNVHERLSNLEAIQDDCQQLIKPEERKALIPVIIRLYYSKYFYITQENKKVKTKNKINLVSFFIQLTDEEFEEYVKIIFEPIEKMANDFNCYRFEYFDTRTYKKILEILQLNLKQITRLFHRHINKIANIVSKTLIFTKRLLDEIKHTYNTSDGDENINQVNHNYSLVTRLEDTIKEGEMHFKTKFFTKKEDMIRFFSFFIKNLKDIKKKSFDMLTVIFSKFYSNQEMINGISWDICKEYHNILVRFHFQDNKSKSVDDDDSFVPKLNSMFKFFLSFAKYHQLHFIYTIPDCQLLESIMGVLRNPRTGREFYLAIIDFFEKLLSPYYNRMDSEPQVVTARNDDVVIEEINMKESSDDSINNQNEDEDEDEIDQQTLQENHKKIIFTYFSEINTSLLSLVKHGKVQRSIKDPVTQRILEILLYLWGMNHFTSIADVIQIQSVKELMDFSFELMNADRKIYSTKNKEILEQLLKICHVLLIILLRDKNIDIDIRKAYYHKFLHLLYKIENTNTRLLLSIILQEFGENEELLRVLELVSGLNAIKKGKRVLEENISENEGNPDIDTIMARLEIIDEEWIGGTSISEERISIFEPLIYQLLVLSKSKDFSLQTIALEKLKFLFKKVFTNTNVVSSNSIQAIFTVFYSLLKVQFSFARAIFEILFLVNSITVEKHFIICCDLFHRIKLQLNPEYNFFEAILSIKYDVRADALKSLTDVLIQCDLNDPPFSKFSIENVLIPVIKNYLSPYTYQAKNYQSDDFTIHRGGSMLQNFIDSAIETIKPLCKWISIDTLKELLLYFCNIVQKLHKKSKQRENVAYTVDVQAMVYKILSKLIEGISELQMASFEFDLNFKAIAREVIAEEKQEVNFVGNVKEFMRKVFDRLQLRYKATESDETFFKRNIQKEDDMNGEGVRIRKELMSLLKSNIFKTLKEMLYDLSHKESGKGYYIRNYVIRPYIQTLKHISPHQTKFELVQLTYELINNLRNRDLGVREKAREGIAIMIKSFGSSYICFMLLEEMKTLLHSGYQRHVMGYTCNFILSSVSDTDEHDMVNMLEYCSSIIAPIVLDELFGEVFEEKEVEMITSKYKEAKKIKAYHSLAMMSSKVSIRCLVVDMIKPLKECLSKIENDIFTVNRANEVINHIVKGLKGNPRMEVDEVIEYSYGLVKVGIEESLKNAKEIKKLKNVEIKGNDVDITSKKCPPGNDIFTLQIGDSGKSYSIEIASKYYQHERNAIIISNLFTSLGLDLFLIAIKKNLIYDEEKKLRPGIEDKITLLLEHVFICLKLSNNNNILSKSIKIAIQLFDLKLLVIKKNLRKIVSILFKNLNIINSKDINIAQAILSAIGTIIEKFSFCEIKDSHLKTLLSFLKLNISNSQIKPYVMSCLLSIIKRKILHPLVYDMIDFIKESYLVSFENATISVCQSILLQFLNSYPLEEKAFANYINFFLINLESNTRLCVLNSLKMILSMLKRDVDYLANFEDFLLLKLFTLITNSDDYEVKELCDEIFHCVFSKIEPSKIIGYASKAEGWISGGSDMGMLRLSLNILSQLCSHKYTGIEDKASGIAKLMKEKIISELNSFDKDLECKLENEEYERNDKYSKKKSEHVFAKRNDEVTIPEDSQEIITVKLENWHVLYSCLVILEKLLAIYPHTLFPTFAADYLLNFIIIKSLLHPQVFIKVISLRIIHCMLSNIHINTIDAFLINISKYSINGESTIEFLLRNIKFILINPDFGNESKIMEYTFKCTHFLLEKLIKNGTQQFFNIAYEFMCRVYVESKCFLSNKELGLKIFPRLFSIYDNISSSIDESSLRSLMEPMLGLIYRVASNSLSEESLRTLGNNLMEKLQSQVDKNFTSKKYKEVRDNINLLKRKRKMALLENFHRNPREYIKQKLKK